MTRRRIDAFFAGIRSNDDVRKYKIARRLLDGEHRWLEAGLAPVPELERFVAEASREEPLVASR